MDDDYPTRDVVSSALEEHVRNFADLLRFALRRHGLAPGDLDELTQEVRLRLWRALRTEEQIAAVSSSYMYRTAMTAAVDLIRRRRHERRAAPLSDDIATPGTGTPRSAGWDAATAEETSRLVQQAFSSLPKDRRVAVRMHLAGYPREEIESLLGWSEARTRNLIYRGLGDLRTRLQELGLKPGDGR